MMKTLSSAEARRVYDRIGRKQDTQAFYEDRATSQLIPHLDLARATSVFELGCGTGRFAASLLRERLPETATYCGIDVSPVMVALARERLAPFGSRAEIRLSDGGPPADQVTASCDRFISNFVLDLLAADDIERMIAEAHRILRPGGLIGLSSLAHGFTPASRAFAWVWARLHALQPSLVGGCRALNLREFLPERHWTLRHHARVAPFGIALEVVVAERKN